MKIKGSTKLFTLTELLIVLAVFFILISLLSPALKNSIEVARGIVCSKKLSLLPQWNIAYAEDHNGSLVTQYQYKDGVGFWTNILLLQAGAPIVTTNYEKYYGCPSRVSPPDSGSPAWGYCSTLALWVDHPSKKLSDIRRPSETLMFVENTGYFYFNTNWDIKPYSPHVNHGRQAYCDGHVSQLSQEEMLFYCKSFPNNIPWWSP